MRWRRDAHRTMKRRTKAFTERARSPNSSPVKPKEKSIEEDNKIRFIAKWSERNSNAFRYWTKCPTPKTLFPPKQMNRFRHVGILNRRRSPTAMKGKIPRSPLSSATSGQDNRVQCEGCPQTTHASGGRQIVLHRVRTERTIQVRTAY